VKAEVKLAEDRLRADNYQLKTRLREVLGIQYIEGPVTGAKGYAELATACGRTEQHTKICLMEVLCIGYIYGPVTGAKIQAAMDTKASLELQNKHSMQKKAKPWPSATLSDLSEAEPLEEVAEEPGFVPSRSTGRVLQQMNADEEAEKTLHVRG
jgi:hypothetical protein